LNGLRQLADLVEEDRPAGGRLEHADAVDIGAGERAAHVPEQLGLDDPGTTGRSGYRSTTGNRR
jgi:hypothetical protein